MVCAVIRPPPASPAAGPPEPTPDAGPTDEYLVGRNQPDKSIQLLDEACAFCVTADPALPEELRDAIAACEEATRQRGRGPVGGDRGRARRSQRAVWASARR